MSCDNEAAEAVARPPQVGAALLRSCQQPLPRLCAAWPGIGGRLKDEPKDFEVEEVPAYLPSGEGEHLYLWLQKRDVPGPAAIERLAAELGVSRDEVGAAGVKDARAVTRQWVSVPRAAQAKLEDPACTEALAAAGLTILQHKLHGNKLRTGHLRGNRFVLQLRDVDVAAAEAQLAPLVAHLGKVGMANFYGAQRFGRGGENVARGLRWLSGAWRGPNRGVQRRFLASAVQSALFNDFLRQRIEDGLLDQVLAGEMMQVAASGGPFFAEDLARESARYAAREVVPTGPMFGAKMRAPTGAAAVREAEVLARGGLDLEAFARAGKLASGTRRPLLVWPEDLSAELDASTATVTLRFTLPPGSYATVLVAELVGDAPRRDPA